MIAALYLHSRSDAKPLRIGVMIDSFLLGRVFRQVIQDIQASDFAKVELVIKNAESQPATLSAGNRLSRYIRLLRDRDRRRILLYARFQKFDRGRLLDSNNPLEDVDCSDILGNRRLLEVTPITKRFVHRFPPDAIEAVRSYELDVILRFGFNILKGDVLTSARYGVWSFHHGDNEFYRGGPALFWEVVEDNPCSGVILQVLNEKLDDGLVLCKSVFATARGLSPSRNLSAPYWGSEHFVIRKLNELHEYGWDTVKRRIVPPAPYRGKVPIYRTPSNLQMVKWLAPKLGKKLIGRLNPARAETVYHWRICLRRADRPKLLTGEAMDKSDFQWLSCPKGHFYADPFLFEHDGQLWLLFEDYLYGERRGRISCVSVSKDLVIGDSHVCLETPYHLSYPFVFRHEGEMFMIPESGSNASVELWRATNFPTAWKLEKKLFSGSLVDTTPLLHEGRWYFFTTLSEPRGNAAFAALFSSDSLTGEWVRHPSTPISTDVRDARSAGAIVRIDGRLLRPVQDCSSNYGRRIYVDEILELTPDTYQARRLHSIEPDWEQGLQGVHTYAFSSGIEALDAASSRKRRSVAP
jgi:hypothetical protein